MRENFDDSFKHLLKHEGGFVNHPKDPGGMTNLGVTKRAWEEYQGREVDEAEMRSLTPTIVAPFYKAKYWDKIKGDDLPAGVDHAVFDYAVNSGTGRAAKALQAAVRVPADGAIGPKTLAAVAAADPEELLDAICDGRMAFLQGLPTFSTFGKGWTRRVAEVEDQARDFMA
jgi:lysozyme family protein